MVAITSTGNGDKLLRNFNQDTRMEWITIVTKLTPVRGLCASMHDRVSG